MRTYSACQGKKYAAYDYEQHMKKSQEKKEYNRFIRAGHRRSSTSPTSKPNKLKRFEEWKAKESGKTSLVTFRGILSDLALNNERGLRQVLKKEGTQKLVLVNHQRKPINYYLYRRGRV